jgi:hypothetical protein
MRLHWKNLIAGASLTATNGDPNYPVSALLDIHLTNVFRFVDLTGGNIDIDLGSAQAVSSVGIIGNLTASATITLKGNSSVSWTSPPVNETMVAADRNLMHYFTETSYRYWRIEITDSGNPEGYIEVANIFLGNYLQMPPVAPDSSHEDESMSSRQFSPNGQPFSVVRPQRQRFSFTYPAVSESERQALRGAFAEVGIHTPVWLVVWENSFDVQEPAYVLFEENFLRWRKNKENGLLWETDLSFVESK